MAAPPPQKPLLALTLALFVLALIVPLYFARAAQQHIVGASTGWTIPAVGNVNYSTWVDDSSSFHAGDTLLFKYDATLHDVVEVMKEDYENCSAASPIARYDDGNTIVALDITGIWYFICGVPGHCSAGQKVAVEVAAELPPAPAPTLAPVPVQVWAPAPAPTLAPVPVQVWAPVSAPTLAPTLVPGSSPFYAPGPSPVFSAIYPSSSIGSVGPSTHLKAGWGSLRAPAPKIKITGAVVSGAFLAASWLASV